MKRKYDEAQGRASSYEELYTLLKTRTQPEAHEMLRRIRAGMDVESVLRYVKDGDLLLQLHLAPEARLRYTFPEFASWPTIFRDPDDPYLRTPLLDSPPGVLTPLGDAASRAPSALLTPTPDEHVYQMPYHAAHVVDPRLSSVRAATWTSVTTDSGLVSRLLAIYFQYEYPGTRILQKDLFLDDLVRGNTGKSSFCSPLLVNAILANAAVSPRTTHDSWPALTMVWNTDSTASPVTPTGSSFGRLNPSRMRSLPRQRGSGILKFPKSPS